MEHRLKRLTQVLLVLLALLGLRLVQLQVVEGARYERLSERNRVRRIELPAARGRILDRHGRVIADTRPAFTLSVIPSELTDTTLVLLAALIGVPDSELMERVRPVSSLSSPVKVRRNLTSEALFRIEENRFRLSGVRVSIDPQRYYPDSGLYCHVLGYLGEVNAADIERDSVYEPLDYIGRTGIEAEYEDLLRGREGLEYVEVDVRGREIGPLREKRTAPARAGCDLHLTIDSRLQRLASDLTRQYDRAAVVGIEILTGDVLCLFSRPTFDPNLFTVPLASEAWESLTQSPDRPFFNRAISAAYPPGSVFKPIVALAGMAHSVVRSESRFRPCTGSLRYGDRTFRCWATHGSLDLPAAIAHSCNVYFYQLGLALGLDSLARYSERLLLDELTGIDLPGERFGTVPTRAWLDDRYGRGSWSSGVRLNFAIGQGEVGLTPIRLAVTYGAIGRDGSCRRPHILARVDSAIGLTRNVRTEVVSLPVSISDLRQVRGALNRVVEHGTGRLARLEEIAIAGKTGTAQNPSGEDHAWFVGYAPADRPEVAFAVLIENAGHGGDVAAPVARQLVRTWFSVPAAE